MRDEVKNMQVLAHTSAIPHVKYAMVVAHGDGGCTIRRLGSHLEKGFPEPIRAGISPISSEPGRPTPSAGIAGEGRRGFRLIVRGSPRLAGRPR